MKTIEVPNNSPKMRTDPTQIEITRASATDRMPKLKESSDKLMDGFFQKANLSEAARAQEC